MGLNSASEGYKAKRKARLHRGSQMGSAPALYEFEDRERLQSHRHRLIFSRGLVPIRVHRIFDLYFDLPWIL